MHGLNAFSEEMNRSFYALVKGRKVRIEPALFCIQGDNPRLAELLSCQLGTAKTSAIPLFNLWRSCSECSTLSSPVDLRTNRDVPEYWTPPPPPPVVGAAAAVPVSSFLALFCCGASATARPPTALKGGAMLQHDYFALAISISEPQQRERAA